jgi:hypothetical protein
VSPEDLLFVVLGNAPYRAVIRTSKQMVAAQIARRHPVLYVEPPPLTLDPLVKPAERGRYFDWRKGVQRLGAGEPLVVCPPPFRQALDTRWRFLDDWNQRRLGRFVEKTLAGFAYRKLVLISFVYNAAHVADIVRPDLFVYYCIDLFSEIRIPYANPRTVERIEDETIRRADVIFAISRADRASDGAASARALRSARRGLRSVRARSAGGRRAGRPREHSAASHRLRRRARPLVRLLAAYRAGAESSRVAVLLRRSGRSAR